MNRNRLLVKSFIVLLCVLSAGYVQAGVVELNNGDRLEGELVRVEGDDLVWQSTNFGEQWLKKANIKNLQFDRPLKINGSKAACMLKRMDAEYLVYQCEKSSRIKRTSLLTVKTLVPYEDYKKGAYVHHGRLNLWGAYSRGNEVRDEWNIQNEVEFRRSDFRHVVKGEFARVSWNHSPPQERWSAQYSLDWFLGEHWFWYNSLVAGVDPARGLRTYERLGSGAGYQFFENKTKALSIKSGLALLDETYQLPKDLVGDYKLEDDFAAVGVAVDFRYLLPWGVGFFHNNEVLQPMTGDSNLQIKTSTGLSSMIMERIYSEFKIDYWLDKDPQPTRQNRDTRMSLGVSYKW
jgi:hypothetical protein